jgi:hypothetical protein
MEQNRLRGDFIDEACPGVGFAEHPPLERLMLRLGNDGTLYLKNEHTNGISSNYKNQNQDQEALPTEPDREAGSTPPLKVH